VSGPEGVAIHHLQEGRRRGRRRELDRPLSAGRGTMVEFREMAKEQAEAARAGDKEAQQKRVYYQGR
jgi:hypothetical protein